MLWPVGSPQPASLRQRWARTDGGMPGHRLSQPWQIKRLLLRQLLARLKELDVPGRANGLAGGGNGRRWSDRPFRPTLCPDRPQLNSVALIKLKVTGDLVQKTKRHAFAPRPTTTRAMASPVPAGTVLSCSFERLSQRASPLAKTRAMMSAATRKPRSWMLSPSNRPLVIRWPKSWIGARPVGRARRFARCLAQLA